MKTLRPQIHSAQRFGVRPGRPLRYRIAASGAQPRTFHADALPATVSLDQATGLLTGSIAESGTYTVRIGVENSAGTVEQNLELVVGPQIGLTPPLGWNSWNCFAEEVSQENVLASARAMVASGLADYGWEFINIDGCWQADRRGGPHGAILAHPERFPDMAGLCEAIHGLGLKVGIYSTPWVSDYGGNIGGSGHTPDGSEWRRKISGGDWAAQWTSLIQDHYRGPYPYDFKDAAQWAEWGIDYLKYDWSPIDLDSTFRMWRALDMSGRDILLSLSNNCPRSIAADVGVYANAWRTTGDLHDLWQTDGLPHSGHVQGLLDVWQMHHFWQPYTGPGHFADPDMLVVGDVRWGPTGKSRLTRDEQRTHVSLWALFAAPLLIGTPLDAIDEWTFSLLTNPSILAINQDTLGIQARPMVHSSSHEVLVKPLADGAHAVGFFNKSDDRIDLEISLQSLDLTSPLLAQNAWQGGEPEIVESVFEQSLPAHGCAVLRCQPLDVA